MPGVGFNPQNPHNPHYQESKERVPCMPESRRDQLRHALNMGPHPTNACPQPPLLAFEKELHAPRWGTAFFAMHAGEALLVWTLTT